MYFANLDTALKEGFERRINKFMPNGYGNFEQKGAYGAGKA